MNSELTPIEFDSIESVEPPTGRRRRVAAGIGAAMLVAAAGGAGFGIGRSVDNGDQLLSPAAQQDDSGDSADNDDEPLDDGDAPAPVASDRVTPQSTSAPADGDSTGADDAVGAESDVSASGGIGYSVFGNAVTSLLFDRSTESGLALRAHLGETWEGEIYDDGYFGGPDGWQPPGWCFETGQVRLALGGNGLIDVGSVSWWSEPYNGRSVSSVTLGRPDDDPHRVVFVQAPADTTLVTATFGDGTVDSVAPQNGVAVLVAAGEPETIEHTENGYTWYEETPDFVVTFDNGAEPVEVNSSDVGTWNDPEFQASCSPPPPALPEPGEQPADAAAAEAAVIEVMSTVYGQQGEKPLEDLVDDTTGIEAAREQVRESGYAEEAANAEAIVEELVFTAPTEAWFRYRIETGGVGLNERYGMALMNDGVWKITRATICQDLQMAGGSCGNDIGTIRPPGFEHDEPSYIDDVPAATVVLEIKD